VVFPLKRLKPRKMLKASRNLSYTKGFQTSHVAQHSGVGST
jgi:hypothetical protein